MALYKSSDKILNHGQTLRVLQLRDQMQKVSAGSKKAYFNRVMFTALVVYHSSINLRQYYENYTTRFS